MSMDKSDIGMRMKEYESRNRYYLQKKLPVIIRCDMRSGHTFTRGFKRPFDQIFMETMQETAKYLSENISGVKYSYVQSDEISLFLSGYHKLETQPFFEYRIDKLCSISASMATMIFNMVFRANVYDYTEDAIKSYNIPNMLHEEKGINWNDFPTTQKRGSCCIKGEHGWDIDNEIPIFKGEGRDYIEKLVWIGE